MPSMTVVSELIRLIPSFLLRCRVVRATEFNSACPREQKILTVVLEQNRALHRKSRVVLILFWLVSL